jgi:hypothetical protein
MGKSKLEIGAFSDPRFEFRTFGREFDNAAKRMLRLSIPVPEDLWERRSEEIYIVSAANNTNNTKIRNGKMDIKTFVTENMGLEQWNPLLKGEFPISKDVLEKEVFPAFAVDMPALIKDLYSLNEFLELVKTNSSLKSVSVEKQRFAYLVNNTICEVANVWINGARLVSINSESTDLDDILKTIKDVGIDGCENINYLQAIKRVIGMIDKPFAN